ncbi:MAG: SDR family NAD(P)-dependent oxidoreductase [Arachidicoccus sp.]|nr:SDR family NAD(P)-dependent oxidoreductase [Arachidicoccus sp.]
MEQKKEILKDKKIIIIGGSAGIGLATAKAVAAKGAIVIIVSSNQQRISNALQSLPKNAKGIVINASDERQIKNLFEQVGSFDHLVYTAGENLRLNNIADTEIASAQQFFNVRYWGAFTAVKYVAPHISKSGSIVLTGGIAGARPNKGWSVAASIASAMEGFTRAMAMELAPVRVNVVSPGIVRTDLWSSMPETDRENLRERYFFTSIVSVSVY